MATNKVTRPNPPAQPQPQQHQRQQVDHQLKAEIFEVLRRLNRGYGLALTALDKLDSKDRNTRRIFPTGFCINTGAAQRSCGPRPIATCSAALPNARSRRPSGWQKTK